MESLHSLFEQKADQYPNHICLVGERNELSYQQVENLANQLAHWLIKNGIQPEAKIGILIDRSLDFYVVMLAIMKAGAAYIPIDPEYPLQRIEYILQDAQIDMLISSRTLSSPNIPEQKITLLESIKSYVAAQPTSRLSLPGFSLNNLCYIIYTSGTTGKPKGVEITHRSIVNYVISALKIYGINKHDRVYQGFTVAFDAAIEEMWLAFASGGTLVSATHKEVREGAALLDFLNFHRITVFSTVPTLLSMLEPNAPNLKVLILGGEVCPQLLVKKWARPNLRIFNTYGPSETTVIATYLECLPDKKVTIGHPIPNYEVCILNEDLQPVPVGEVGELCIGGIGLARGYLNKPDLTEKKFITHPLDAQKRLYRTGDLAFINEEDEIEYVGRLDEQVKLRGFRIELQEIEKVIRQFPGIQNTAVTVQELESGMQFLVAYLVPKADQTISIDDLKKSLHTLLPAYMVPTLFEILEALPQLPSGKVDKKALPKFYVKKQASLEYKAPETETEKHITSIWESVLKVSPISTEANFFTELGGHSLAAATTVSKIRNHAMMSQISLVNLFENPTIKQLAYCIDQMKGGAQEGGRESDLSDQPKQLKDKIYQMMCCSAQAIVTLFLVTLPSWYFFMILLIAVSFSFYQAGMSITYLVELWLGFIFLLEPALIGFSVLVKWLLLGEIKPGRYKLWGWYYLRWWIVNQVQDLAPVEHLIGTPFMIGYLRLMGAKIGKNCYIGTDHIGSFDLIAIGDQTSLCADVIASGYKIENGWLKIGSITLGDNCYVGANSVLSINTQMQSGSKLAEQSLLSDGETLLSNRVYMGSPCKPSPSEHLPFTHAMQPQSSKFLSALQIFCHYSLLIILELIYTMATIPGIILIVYCYLQQNMSNLLWTVPLASLLYLVMLLGQIFLFKSLFASIKPGSYSIKSFYYLKIWFVDRLMALSLKTLEPLYGTIYSGYLFRLLGAHIGKGTELSTVSFTLPDMLHIGQEAFIADNCLLAPARVYQGWLYIKPIYIQNRVFIGNSALVPGDANIEEESLIGCASLAPKNVPKNTNWIGTPPLFLPRRQEKTFSDQTIFNPPLWAKLGRGFIEFLRILLPSLFLYLILILDIITFHNLETYVGLGFTLLLFPFFSFFYVILEVFFIIFLKWLLIGKYTDSETPMWQSFVWKSELITVLYDNIAVPFLLEALLGTPFIQVFLRCFGVNIGKSTFINTVYFSEFDLVYIGDNASLNRETILQTHLFEDRVFKMGKINIEKGCVVGDRSIILYGTTMKNHASLGNLSLLMKGEVLYPYSYWEGVPAKRVYRSAFKDKV